MNPRTVSIPDDVIEATLRCNGNFDYTPGQKEAQCYGCGEYTYPTAIPTRADSMRHALEAAMPHIRKQIAAEIKAANSSLLDEHASAYPRFPNESEGFQVGMLAGMVLAAEIVEGERP